MGIRGSFKPIGYGQAQSGAGKEVEREFRVSPDLDPTHPVLTGPLSGTSNCKKMLLYVFFSQIGVVWGVGQDGCHKMTFW